MLRFGETKVAKEKFYAAEKPIKFCGVNIDNIAISKLMKLLKQKLILTIWLDI